MHSRYPLSGLLFSATVGATKSELCFCLLFLWKIFNGREGKVLVCGATNAIGSAAVELLNR